jgi:hypothetical protein
MREDRSQGGGIPPGQEADVNEVRAAAGVTPRDRLSTKPRSPARSWLTAHRLFLVAVGLGAALRVAVMVGYPPVMWFNDSYDYVAAALYPHPGRLRPSGYALVLRTLLPFHSLALVAAVQHAAGLAIAVACYAVTRRAGLPGWGATLVAAPVLFDAYQLQLEQAVLSDTLFMLLVTLAVVAVCRSGRPSTPACAGAAVLLGLAAITRTVGLPLLVLLIGYLLLRRVGRRSFAAAVVAGSLPVAAYAGWFHAAYGRYGLTGADGIFLYGRTMAFADCGRMRPPTSLRPLCADLPPEWRPPSQKYIWDPRAPFGRRHPRPFNDLANEQAGRFAALAIQRQPLDYLAVVGRDTARAFRWERRVFPDRPTYAQYEFDRRVERPPGWAPPYLDQYDPGWARTRTVDPYATFLSDYQRQIYLRGTMLGMILLVGAVGVVGGIATRSHGRAARADPAAGTHAGRSAGARAVFGGSGLLPMVMSVTLIVAPAATAEFGYRYVLAAVPLACVAAGLAVASYGRGRSGPASSGDRIPRGGGIP